MTRLPRMTTSDRVKIMRNIFSENSTIRCDLLLVSSYCGGRLAFRLAGFFPFFWWCGGIRQPPHLCRNLADLKWILKELKYVRKH